MNSRTNSHMLMTVLLALVMFGSALSLIPIAAGGDKPDLTLEDRDIHVDTSPDEGDEVPIHATIHNTGDGDASNVTVRFKDYSHVDKEWTTIGTKLIERLESGSSINVSVEWEASPQGNHTILVEIDHENEIVESDEDNNAAEKAVQVQKNQGNGDTILQGYTKKNSDSTHIPSVSIRVTRGNFSETFSSDEEGWYEVELPEGGVYDVRAEKDGYEDFEDEIEVADGKTTTFHARMTETSSGDKTILQGYTKEKTNSTHIPEVFIRVHLGNYSKTTESDKDGYYEVELEHGGNFTVVAEKEGYERFEEVVAVEDGKTTTYHIRMTEDSTEKTIIVGHVYENESRGTPIEHAEITIVGETTEDSYTTYTDSHGYYEQELEHEDNYTITADAEGYVSDQQHKYIEEGDTAEVNFHLEKESGTEKTILKGYTKEKENSTHLSNVWIRVTKGNYTETTESDEDGYYEFELEEGGTYDVRAEKDGYQDHESNVTAEDGKTTSYNIWMDPAEGGDTYVLGHVFGPEGRGGSPVNDASVTITDLACHCPYRTYTNKDGYYQYKLPGEGNYSIEVEKDGYETQEMTVFIEEGEEKRVDFHMEDEKPHENRTILKGYTKTQNRGTHIKFVNISIAQLDGNHTNSTTSGENGYYEFILPEGGTYQIEAHKDGFKDYIINISIEDDEEKLHYIYMEEAAGGRDHPILKGHIREESRGGGIHGVMVNITNDDDEEFSFDAESDQNGQYEIELEHPNGDDMSGTYTLVAWKEGYEVFEGSVTVEEGAVTIYNISLIREETEHAILTGYVRDKPDISPLIPATITVTGLECNCSYTTETDQHGHYEIEALLSGNYTITVSFEGYETITKTVHLTVGKVTTQNFNLERIVTVLVGSVWKQTKGNGIQGALVQAVYGEEEYEAITDRYGHFEITLEDGGIFIVTASKEGYLSQVKNVTVEKGETVILDFTLEIDESTVPGKDRYGVEIEAGLKTIDLEGKNRAVVTLTVTNIGQEDDTYSLSLAGSYKGWKASYDSPDSVTLKAGSTHTITLTLSEDATLSPEGDTIIVEVVVRSETYSDVYDSARIEGKLESDSPIPDLTVPFIVASLSAGALVASFRRRH